MVRDEDSIWTSANIITLVRICLVPVFVVALLSPWPSWFGIENLVTYELKSFIAALVFIVISCTDWIDGYLARSRNQVTDFGKFIDPLADKILVMAALLSLIELQVLPSWPVLIMLIREFIVSGLRMLAASKGVVIAASWYGKAKTVLQIVAIVLFLFKDGIYLPSVKSITENPFYIFAWLVMIAALVMTVVSMLDYISKSKELLGFGKNGKALKQQSRSIRDLAAEVVSGATAKGVSLATAESLTGGKIAAAITSVPGSSAVFKGSIVSYVNSVKDSLLHVDAQMLESDGAVNSSTALQMAEGACVAIGARAAVSVTGIAGPGGAEEGKPVGTVYIGWTFDGISGSEKFDFDGDREAVRDATVRKALDILLKLVEKEA